MVAAVNTQSEAEPVAQGDYVRPRQRRHGAQALGKRGHSLSPRRELRVWAQAEKIGLTVVGPEAPLAAAWWTSSRPRPAHLGPTKAAAQLESSRRSPRPSCAATAFPRPTTTPSPTRLRPHAFRDRLGAPIVIKADGLAAGKGVVVAMTLQEAHGAVDFMLVDNKFGVTHNEGGARVVIEQFLEGEEASFIVLCDGKNVLRWPPARTTSA